MKTFIIKIKQKTKSMDYRDYQQDADDAIFTELVTNNTDKCLVKMFCGAGKSLLMRNCAVAQDKALVVYVFPSLNLIDQFYSEYLYNDYPRPQAELFLRPTPV